MAAAKEFSVHPHDWRSQDYVDEWISRDIQKDDVRKPRLRQMLSHAPAPRAAAVSVLDVGGGFGVVSEEVLAAFPKARVTLQDFSQPMLGHARARLAAHGDQVRYVLADLTDPAWTAKVGGPFDLVVSSWAIHNLRQAEPLGACYRAIAGLLGPGGAFLTFDLVEHSGGVALHTELMRKAGSARVECHWYEAPAAILAGYAS